MLNQGDVEGSPDSFDDGSSRAIVDGSDKNHLPSLVILLAGTVALGAVGGWFLASRAAGTPVMAMVPSQEIREAVATLSPQGIQEARALSYEECRIPMGSIIVATPENPAGGTVRFRTGRYQSPPFIVTDQPQRIAIPNPLPEGGIGSLSVDGEAKGLVVGLSPPRKMEPVNGTATIEVIFLPAPPCKS